MSQCAEKPGNLLGTQMATTASADAGCVRQADVGRGGMEVEAGRIEDGERRMPMAISVGAESTKASNGIFISPWQCHDDTKPLPVMFIDLSLSDRALAHSLLAMLCTPSCCIYALHSSLASRCRAALSACAL